MKEEVREEFVERVKQLRERLKKEAGIDLDDPNAVEDLLRSPDKLATMARVASVGNSDFFDKTFELWRNALLSGPTTAVVNAFSSPLHAAFRFLLKKPIEAVAREVGGKGGEGYSAIEELKTYGRVALWKTLQESLTNMRDTWNWEQSAFDVRHGNKDLLTHWDSASGPAIGGTLGRVIRGIGYRPAMAVDAFMKTLVANIEVGASAYRVGKQKGLAGTKLDTFIQEQVASYDSEAWQDASQEAATATFNNPNAFANLVKQGSEALKTLGPLGRVAFELSRYVTPFVNTPSNIVARGAELTPGVGAAIGAYEMIQAVRSGDYSKVPAPVANIVLSTVLGVVITSILGDDEDPYITGAIDVPWSTKNQQKRPPPFSIKYNGKWYSYGKVEPAAIAIGTAVDFSRALRKAFTTGDFSKVAETATSSFAGQIKDKSMLKGLSDVMRIVTARSYDEGVEHISRCHAVRSVV
jgi:hypothetical protein